MDISYKSNKLRKSLENEKSIKKKYGAEKLKRIVMRLEQLSNAETLQDIAANKSAKLHSLEDEYKGCFAVSITGSWRLIFKPLDGEDMEPSTVTAIRIEAVKDYH